MQLYWLERIGPAKPGERVYVLTFAADEGEARLIADGACLAEGPIWTDPVEVSCKLVVPGSDPRIVTLGRMAHQGTDVINTFNRVDLRSRVDRGEMPCP